MVPILMAAADFEVRTLVVGLVVALVVALVAFLVCLLLNHLGVPVPGQIVAALVFVIVLLLYVVDALE